MHIAKQLLVLFYILCTNNNFFKDIVLSSTQEVESFKIKYQLLVTAIFPSVTIFIIQQMRTNVMVTSIYFLTAFWLFFIDFSLTCFCIEYMCIYANITLTKIVPQLILPYMWFMFIITIIKHFYVLLKMTDPDCYDLVSRSAIKPSTTTDSTSTLAQSDTGQDHRCV